MTGEAAHKAIEAAIAAAERGTRAEFVAAVARRADRYDADALRAGLLVALLVAVAVWWFTPWPLPLDVILAEITAFFVVYGLARFTPLGLLLVPAARKRQRAGRLARLIFLDRGLASTPERCGVLLFVAVGERCVEIIADRGIDQAVEPGAWQRIVDTFTAEVRKGAIEAALVAAIEALGALLARHYPPAGDNPNRIPDRLIEV
jgi:putative membrane protein